MEPAFTAVQIDNGNAGICKCPTYFRPGTTIIKLHADRDGFIVFRDQANQRIADHSGCRPGKGLGFFTRPEKVTQIGQQASLQFQSLLGGIRNASPGDQLIRLIFNIKPAYLHLCGLASHTGSHPNLKNDFLFAGRWVIRQLYKVSGTLAEICKFGLQDAQLWTVEADAKTPLGQIAVYRRPDSARHVVDQEPEPTIQLFDNVVFIKDVRCHVRRTRNIGRIHFAGVGRLDIADGHGLAETGIVGSGRQFQWLPFRGIHITLGTVINQTASRSCCQKQQPGHNNNRLQHQGTTGSF